MHVWSALYAARWKYRMQKIAILTPSHNFVGLYLRSWGMYRQSEKNLLNADTSSTCPQNMVNLRATNGWDLLVSLGHPFQFQWLSHLGSVTARHSSSGHQRRWTEGAIYILQGNHHVGHWPTFLLNGVLSRNTNLNSNASPNANPNPINEYNIHNKWKARCATCRMKCRNPPILFWFARICSPWSTGTSTHIHSQVLSIL